MMDLLRHKLLRFWRARSGATAVEFAILMPIMMVTFGAIVEGARIYWNYQGAVSGVRDATRYLSRITNEDVCVDKGVGEHDIVANTDARPRIEANMRTGGTENLFPTAVSLASLQTRVLCTQSPTDPAVLVPIAVVRANVVIDLPFGEVFRFFGQRNTDSLNTWVVDQSRIYGI